MQTILALIAILFFGTLALCAFAALFSVVFVGALTLTVYVLPRMLLHTGVFILHASGMALFFSLATLREITGQAARGIAVWEAQPQRQHTAQDTLTIPQIKSWQSACDLLGLPIEGFDRETLAKAYRKAIVQSHPDLGGNAAMASAINVARDLIRQHQGWH